MPIYEYHCSHCDINFETIASTIDKPLPACPNCKSRKIKKLISSGFIRPYGIPKGSGGFTSPKCKSSGGG